MDYVKSVTYVTEDESWLKKIGIGSLMALLSFILVGSWALTGWGLEIYRRERDNAIEKLPDWTGQFGPYIIDGLKMFIITLVWMLPYIIISSIFGGFGAMMASSGSDAAAAGAGFGAFVMVLFSIVYSVAVGVLAVGAWIIFAETGDLGKAINPMNAWAVVKQDLGKVVITVIVAAVIMGILGAIGGIICGIGTVIGTAWGTASMGNLIGQLVKEVDFEL